MIKIYNPRALLRQGSKQMLTDAVAGHDVLFRAGGLAKVGRPVVSCPNHGNALSAYGEEITSKVFRLVEVPQEEIEALQQQLDAQSAENLPSN